MLKVLLVDDEASIINGLKCLIDWEKYGFCIANTARSAIAAEKILEEEKIDLVICDVQMPKMSGIELLERTLKKRSDIKFIIISGYDEFEYVKKAMDYKISGYVLKPIDEDEMISLLKSVKKDFASRSLYLNQMLYRLLHNEKITAENHDEFEDLERELGIFENEFFYYVQVKCKDTIDGINSIERTNDLSSFSVIITNAIKRFLGKEFEYFVVNDSSEGAGIVINSDMIKKFDDEDDLLYSLKSYLDQNNINACMLCGAKVDKIFDIVKSRQGIKHLEDILFYKETESVLKYEDYEDVKFSYLSHNTDFLNDFMDNIADGKEVEYCVENFINQAKEMLFSPEIFKGYINSIVISMIKTVTDAGGDVLKITAKHSVFHRSKNINISMIEMFLKDILNEYLTSLSKAHSTKGYAGEIAEYVKNNYNEDITLSYFAKKYYLNTSYLGFIFKQKMGVSFNKYLNIRRMEEAKKLLKNTDLKIYEIASKVGFKDSGYFSRKFESYTNLSPIEFRKDG